MQPLKTPFELAALATAAIPGLEVTAVLGPQILEEHLASTRISDSKGNRWTVTVADEEASSSEMDNRQKLLEFLSTCHRSNLLPFSVPTLIAFAPAGGGRHACVFTVEPGSPVEEGQLEDAGLLSSTLGRALAAFHNLEPRALEELGCEALKVPKIRADLLTSISAVGREIPGRLRKRWVNAIEEEVLWGFNPAPTHSALSLESLLVSHGAVQAITGCELARVADPAFDLSWLLPLVSDDFLESLVPAYSAARSTPDLHLFTRAQLYSELALLDWLRFGLAQHDAEIVAEAKQMLVELDADLAGAALVERSRPVVEVHFEAADEPLNRVAQSAPSVGWETQAHENAWGDDGGADDFEGPTEMIEPATEEGAASPEDATGRGDGDAKRSGDSYEFPLN